MFWCLFSPFLCICGELAALSFLHFIVILFVSLFFFLSSVFFLSCVGFSSMFFLFSVYFFLTRSIVQICCMLIAFGSAGFGGRCLLFACCCFVLRGSSRLKLIDPKYKKPTRVVWGRNPNTGSRVRVSVLSGAILKFPRRPRTPTPIVDGPKDTPAAVASLVTFDPALDSLEALD